MKQEEENDLDHGGTLGKTMSHDMDHGNVVDLDPGARAGLSHGAEVGLDHGALEVLGRGVVVDSGTMEALGHGSVADCGTVEDLGRGAMADRRPGDHQVRSRGAWIHGGAGRAGIHVGAETRTDHLTVTDSLHSRNSADCEFMNGLHGRDRTSRWFMNGLLGRDRTGREFMNGLPAVTGQAESS